MENFRHPPVKRKGNDPPAGAPGCRHCAPETLWPAKAIVRECHRPPGRGALGRRGVGRGPARRQAPKGVKAKDADGVKAKGAPATKRAAKPVGALSWRLLWRLAFAPPTPCRAISLQGALRAATPGRACRSVPVKGQGRRVFRPETGRFPFAGGRHLLLPIDPVGEGGIATRHDPPPPFRAPHTSTLSAAMNASCGISTLPNWRIRFLPSFCLSSNLRLRVMSPP